jgi:hypothetical protein
VNLSHSRFFQGYHLFQGFIFLQQVFKVIAGNGAGFKLFNPLLQVLPDISQRLLPICLRGIFIVFQ